MTRFGNTEYQSIEQAMAYAATQGLWTPARQGLVAWTMDPNTTSAGQTPTVGAVHLMPIFPVMDAPVTQMFSGVTTGAVTPTSGQNLMGIYDQNGNLLRGSADLTAQISGTGLMTAVLTSALNLFTGVFYYAGFLQNAATGAALRGGYNSSVVNSGNNTRFLRTSAANLTALPNPIGALIAGTFCPYIGIV